MTDTVIGARGEVLASGRRGTAPAIDGIDGSDTRDSHRQGLAPPPVRYEDQAVRHRREQRQRSGATPGVVLLSVAALWTTTLGTVAAQSAVRSPDFAQYCRSVLVAHQFAAFAGDLSRCAPVTIDDAAKPLGMRPVAALRVRRASNVPSLAVDGQSGCLLEARADLRQEGRKPANAAEASASLLKLLGGLNLETATGVGQYGVTFRYQDPKWGHGGYVKLQRTGSAWPFATEFMAVVVPDIDRERRLEWIHLNVSFDELPRGATVSLGPGHAASAATAAIRGSDFLQSKFGRGAVRQADVQVIKVFDPMVMHANEFLAKGQVREQTCGLLAATGVLDLVYSVAAQVKAGQAAFKVGVDVDAGSGEAVGGGWVDPDAPLEPAVPAVLPFVSREPIHERAANSIRFGWDFVNCSYDKTYPGPVRVIAKPDAVPRSVRIIHSPGLYDATVDLVTGTLVELALPPRPAPSTPELTKQQVEELVGFCQKAGLASSMGFDEVGVHFAHDKALWDTNGRALLIPRMWGRHLFLDEFLDGRMTSVSPPVANRILVKTTFRELVDTPVSKPSVENAKATLAAKLRDDGFRTLLLGRDAPPSAELEIETTPQPLLVERNSQFAGQRQPGGPRSTPTLNEARLAHVFVVRSVTATDSILGAVTGVSVADLLPSPPACCAATTSSVPSERPPFSGPFLPTGKWGKRGSGGNRRWLMDDGGSVRARGAVQGRRPVTRRSPAVGARGRAHLQPEVASGVPRRSRQAKAGVASYSPRRRQINRE